MSLFGLTLTLVLIEVYSLESLGGKETSKETFADLGLPLTATETYNKPTIRPAVSYNKPTDDKEGEGIFVV